MRDTVMGLDLIPKDEEPDDEEPKPQPPRHERKNKRQPLKKGQKSARKTESSPPTEETENPPVIHETEDSIHERAIRNKFPVVLTTYDIIMKDRTHLVRYPWGFIVVDEGHRLKNMDCKLMREIKQYESAGRMILTGTPLHVSRFCYRQLCLSHLCRITCLSCGRYSTLSFPIFSMTSTLSKSGTSGCTFLDITDTP